MSPLCNDAMQIILMELLADIGYLPRRELALDGDGICAAPIYEPDIQLGPLEGGGLGKDFP